MKVKINKLLLAMAAVAFAVAMAVPSLAFAAGSVAAVEDANGNVTECASLQEALDLAVATCDSAGEYERYVFVNLFDDVDLGSSGVTVPAASFPDSDVYLMLNGFTLTSSSPEYTLKVEEGVRVQIVNGVISNSAKSGKSVIANYGLLYFGEMNYSDSAATSHHTSVVAKQGIDCALFNQHGAEFTIENSIVEGGDYAIISYGNATISDSTITGDVVMDDLVDDETSPHLTMWSGQLDGGFVEGEACDGTDVKVLGGRFTADPSRFVSGLGEYAVMYGPVDGFYIVSELQFYDEEGCLRDESCMLSQYDDTNPKAWYHDGMVWGLSSGIIRGYDSADYTVWNVGPLDNLTREQFAVMMYRYAESLNFDMTVALEADLGTFKDARKIGSWAKEAVRWACATGVLRGYGDGSVLGPQDPITREQIAVMLHRFAEYANMDTSVGEDTNILSYEDFHKIGAFSPTALQWAIGEGIITGYTKNDVPTGYLGPKDTTKRAEAVTMLMRMYYLDVAEG